MLPKQEPSPIKQTVRNDHGKISGLPSFESFLQQGDFQEGTDAAYLIYYGKFHEFVSKQLAFRPNVKDLSMYQWLEEIRGKKPLSKENETLYNQTLLKCRTENCGRPASTQECFDALLKFKEAVDKQKVKLPAISDKISNDKKFLDKKKTDKKFNPNKKCKLKLNKNNSMLNMAPIRQENDDIPAEKAFQVPHSNIFNMKEEDSYPHNPQGGKKNKSEEKKNRKAFVVPQGADGADELENEDVPKIMRQTRAIFGANKPYSKEIYNRRNIHQQEHDTFNNLFSKNVNGSLIGNEEGGGVCYVYNSNHIYKKYNENLLRPANWHSHPKEGKNFKPLKKIKKNGSTLNIQQTLPRIYERIHQ